MGQRYLLEDMYLEYYQLNNDCGDGILLSSGSAPKYCHKLTPLTMSFKNVRCGKPSEIKSYTDSPAVKAQDICSQLSQSHLSTKNVGCHWVAFYLLLLTIHCMEAQRKWEAKSNCSIHFKAMERCHYFRIFACQKHPQGQVNFSEQWKAFAGMNANYFSWPQGYQFFWVSWGSC